MRRFRVTYAGRLAKYAATLTKGTHLHIPGELITRQYTAMDGSTNFVTGIGVQRINR